jgi:hypothetical protein
MGRRPRHRPRSTLTRLPPCTTWWRPVGIEQVTVTGVQASQSAGQDRTPTTTPAQASLLEEAS